MRLQRKYRTLEIVNNNRVTTFRPQWRMFFIWMNVEDPKDRSEILEVNTLEKAERYIAGLEKKRIGERVAKKQVHPFNLVFHRLKDNE